MMTPASRYEPSPRPLPAGEPGLSQVPRRLQKEWFGDPHSPANEAGTRTFKELLLMPRAAAIGVGAFLYPKLDEIERDPKGFSNGFIIDRTLATCREINVRCVDLRPDSLETGRTNSITTPAGKPIESPRRPS